MPTQKQRRDAARRHLERQLQRRAEKEASRRRFTLIASVIGTLIVIAVVVVAITMAGGDDKKPAASQPTGTTAPTGQATTPTAPTPTPSTSYPPAKGASVTFDGVTVTGAADLTGVPGVTSKSSTDPAKLEYKDLVVGTGAAATPTSSVNVQYYGVLYKDGTYFDSSWKRGAPATFSLTGVVAGFTQGIGGTDGVPPMKVGGRRIIIMPASLGYGAQGSGAVPPNAPLVFVVDLLGVSK